MYDFKAHLARAGINKSKLAKELGLNPRTISTWVNDPPTYARAYLDLLIAYKRIAP